MLSFFNQDIKGFIYLAGILVSSALSYLMAHTIQDEPNPEKTVLCTILDIEDFATPVISNVIIAFTATYLLLPMRFNNNLLHSTASASCSSRKKIIASSYSFLILLDLH